MIIYANLPTDKAGWVDAMKYKPNEYDLVKIILKSGRILTGWWNGTEYYSRKNKAKEEIVKWKKTYVGSK